MLLRLFFLLLFFPFISSAQILITEVMYNPEGNDKDREWFEAINLGNDFEVLTGRNGWRIYDGKNRLLKGENFIWRRNEIIIFVQDKNKFLEEYSQINCRIVESSFTLKNKEGEIKILDKNKNTLAEFKYSSSLGANGNGYSLISESGIIKEGNFKNGKPCIYPEPLVNKQKDIQVTTSSENFLSLKEETSTPTIKEEISKQEITEIQEPDYSNLLITEFLPNPYGKDEDEFIEIYNEGDEELDLNKIFLKIGNKSHRLFGVIKPKEFKVFSKKELNFNIKNKGEEITILLGKEKELFSIKYTGKAPEGKSFARDEYGKWRWTIPTPGKENIFSEEIEEKNLTLKTPLNNQKENLAFDENIYNPSFQIKQPANIFNIADLKVIFIGFLLALIISGLVIFFLK